jgi:transposase
VPGVNLICAATFLAAVGDPSRFLTNRKLVAYLGLDPKVKRSGNRLSFSSTSRRSPNIVRWVTPAIAYPWPKLKAAPRR